MGVGGDVLYVSVGPLSADGVRVEQRGAPGLVPPLPGLLPLRLLQDKLLLGGPVLVPVLDGAGHVLPQPGGGRTQETCSESFPIHSLTVPYIVFMI